MVGTRGATDGTSSGSTLGHVNDESTDHGEFQDQPAAHDAVGPETRTAAAADGGAPSAPATTPGGSPPAWGPGGGPAWGPGGGPAFPTYRAGFRPGPEWPPTAPPQPRRPPLSPEERRRRTRAGVVISSLVVIALAAGIGIGVWIAPTSPEAVARSLFTSSVAAATHAGSYHYVERSTTDGFPDDIVGTAAPNSGLQHIIERGSSGTNSFDLRLVNGIVYFRGNQAAVIDQLGVPLPKAPSIAQRWVSVRRSDAVYRGFEAGITTKSNISQLTSVMVPGSTTPLSGSSEPQTQIVGGVVVGSHKQTAGTARLNVINSTSLPVSLTGQASDLTSGATISLAWTFSHWGERVTVKAPSSSTPFASLGATPPSSSGG